MANMTSKKVCVGNGVYENRANAFMALMTFSFLIVMIGLRSGMADTITYIQHFQELPNTYSELNKVIVNESKAKGFYYLAALVKIFISNEYHVWLFILSAITLINPFSTLQVIQNSMCNSDYMRNYKTNTIIIQMHALKLLLVHAKPFSAPRKPYKH